MFPSVGVAKNTCLERVIVVLSGFTAKTVSHGKKSWEGRAGQGRHEDSVSESAANEQSPDDGMQSLIYRLASVPKALASLPPLQIWSGVDRGKGTTCGGTRWSDRRGKVQVQWCHRWVSLWHWLLPPLPSLHQIMHPSSLVRVTHTLSPYSSAGALPVTASLLRPSATELRSDCIVSYYLLPASTYYLLAPINDVN